MASRPGRLRGYGKGPRSAGARYGRHVSRTELQSVLSSHMLELRSYVIVGLARPLVAKHGRHPKPLSIIKGNHGARDIAIARVIRVRLIGRSPHA
jgi:hypothetical protein